ncbi:receptor-like protein EIX1 [Vicia villosa]|uniref:receptor-like protein EIX1 n=1 Tax=Vicia villosa TaxID=3911 RepID=UPI00273BD2DB|nr:receptor-like protein EIX1 [Vicia villosa]
MLDFNFLFCVVSILCISLLCGESSHMNKCVESERKALLKIKDALIHGRDKRFTSWRGEECCKWEGISCDNFTSYVTRLDLNDFGLTGKLDSSICELRHLTSLSLQENQLGGKIPNCIGSFSHLIELNLHGNELVGVVPPSLGNLSNLQTLDLGLNSYLSVNDFEWLSHLSNLRQLDLTMVILSLVVDWLSSISKISSLSELHLSDCRLHNITLKSIPHLNSSISLKSLDLRGNNLNSSILPWIISVSKTLTDLDISYNSLQQSIPYEFGNMIFLQHLDLSYNELQGSIPKSFNSMCQLKELYLNSNKLSGQLSDNIQNYVVQIII